MIFFYRIYIVHDEVKDKHFEMELSWVGAVTQGRHQTVPPEVYTEVKQFAKSVFQKDWLSGDVFNQGMGNGGSIELIYYIRFYVLIYLGQELNATTKFL